MAIANTIPTKIPIINSIFYYTKSQLIFRKKLDSIGDSPIIVIFGPNISGYYTDGKGG